MRGTTWMMAAVVLVGGEYWGGFGHTASPAAMQEIAAAPRSVPPEPWLQGDPADSLYKAGRSALNESRFRDAATAFRRIRERYPRSGYTPDALYWEAFALHRLGGRQSLRSALAALDMQRSRYPQAATRGDGDALRARVNAALAQAGDATSAQEITATAAAAAVAPVPPTPPGSSVSTTTRSRSSTKVRAPRPPRGHRQGDCDDDDDTKAIALNALLQMDAERAVPILEKVLARRDSASVCLRRRAIFLISQKQSGRTEEILVNAVQNDPDAEVRGNAVFWLSQVNSDRAVSALESILRTSRDAELQEKALFALSQQQSPRALGILRAFAEREDAPEELRANAIFWLGQRSGGDNPEYLRSLYGRIRNQELREKILFSVSQSGDPASANWLLGIAKNQQEPIELRKNALFWAGQGKASITELVRLYADVTDAEMREQLVFVYSQRSEREALDKMMDIARRDPDPEIRKKALFWIGQSKDPRATQLIQDILEAE